MEHKNTLFYLFANKEPTLTECKKTRSEKAGNPPFPPHFHLLCHECRSWQHFVSLLKLCFYVFEQNCIFAASQQSMRTSTLLREGKKNCSYWNVFPSVSRHQTMVQIVLRLGSKRTTFPSAAFVFVLYMGFSNVACPLLFSWTEHPVYWALSVFLWNRKDE